MRNVRDDQSVKNGDALRPSLSFNENPGARINVKSNFEFVSIMHFPDSIEGKKTRCGVSPYSRSLLL